jgi:ubiquinone biosynthesis protein UbiJ
MNPLEGILRPITRILNRNIGETTPARELCERLDGTTVAVRVRDTALAMYFEISDGVIALATDSDSDPDILITGSLLTLARMAGSSGEEALRDGTLEITGDVRTAKAFQELLDCAKPDIEEGLSSLIGDAAAHRLGSFARGIGSWSRDARSTMGSNVREFLQEESRDLPSRYEVERFTEQLDALRDDVARLEARFDRLGDGA